MSIPVLLIATATRWYGTARMPRNFAHAGFEVALLAPKGSFAEASRFVTRIGHLPEHATANDWLYSFAATVEAVRPRLVVPCDDMAFRLLAALANTPEPQMRPELRLQLVALITESLGERAHYRTSVDKLRLPVAAQALGVRVPPFAIARNTGDAERIAADFGYPVVTKRAHSSAGEGVAICNDRNELLRSFGDHAMSASLALDEIDSGEVLVQKHIDGTIRYRNIAAWKGATLGGFAVDRVQAQVEPKGPAAVIRWHHDPQLADIADRLVRGFGMSGLFAVECMIENGTGIAYLLEINRRLTPGMHVGESIGVDLAMAMHDAISGSEPRSRKDVAPTEEGIHVHFPQEWLRDPRSDYLLRHAVDLPWDDPDLLAAFVEAHKE